MTVAEKNILEAYISMFENFNSNLKSEILKRLVKNSKTNPIVEDKEMNGLEKSFGGWESDLSPEEEVAQIRAARRFREKNISLD